MHLVPSGRLIKALRATLVEVEQTAGVCSDDPALLALKQIVQRKIADLEIGLGMALAPVDPGEAKKSSPLQTEAVAD